MVLLLEKHNNNFVGFVKQKKKTTTHHDNNHHKGLELFRADAIYVYWCVTCWNATGVSNAQTPSTQASLRWANIVIAHQAHRSANIKHLPGLGSMKEWAKPLGCSHVTPSENTQTDLGRVSGFTSGKKGMIHHYFVHVCLCGSGLPSEPVWTDLLWHLFFYGPF